MTHDPQATTSAAPRRSRRVLELIAVFKFIKAASLVAAGCAGLGLLDPRVSARAADWLDQLALGRDSRLIAGLAERAIPMLDNTTPHRLVLLAAGAFAYASVFIVEGVGLMRARPWAEYLTIGVTCSFLPLEVVALMHRATPFRALTLVLNVAVVVYLVWRLRSERRDARAAMVAA